MTLLCFGQYSVPLATGANAASGGGGIAFVQGATGNGTYGTDTTSQATTTSLNVTGGASVLAVVYCSTDGTVSSVTDTAGDAFTGLTSTAGGAGESAQIYYSLGVASNSAEYFTCNYTALTNGSNNVIVLIYGVLTTGSDSGANVASDNNNNPSPITSSSFSTGHAAELVIACTTVEGSSGQTVTKGNIGSTTSNLRESLPYPASTTSSACEDVIFSTTQSSITAKMTWSTTNFSWAMNVGGFY